MPVLAVVRPLATVAVLLAAYYLLPVDQRLTGWRLVFLLAGLCLVIVIVGWQAKRILRAKFPVWQGVQALALSVPLFLLVFANSYYVLSDNLPASFTEPLTRTDALYFTVTVFATVGFGDIAPVSQSARLLVTGQMAGNLLVLGAAVRIIVAAVKRSRSRAD